MYRVGLPGWKLAARYLRVPLLVKLSVLHDKEAGVFVVTSPDLRGLVVEMADTSAAEELHREIHGCVDMMLHELLHTPRKSATVTAWPEEFQPA